MLDICFFQGVLEDVDWETELSPVPWWFCFIPTTDTGFRRPSKKKPVIDSHVNYRGLPEEASSPRGSTGCSFNLSLEETSPPPPSFHALTAEQKPNAANAKLINRKAAAGPQTDLQRQQGNALPPRTCEL